MREETYAKATERVWHLKWAGIGMAKEEGVCACLCVYVCVFSAGHEI